MWNIYTMEYYSAKKNNNIMKFADKLKELENILSEVTQTQDKHAIPAAVAAVVNTATVATTVTVMSKSLFGRYRLMYVKNSIIWQGNKQYILHMLTAEEHVMSVKAVGTERLAIVLVSLPVTVIECPGKCNLTLRLLAAVQLRSIWTQRLSVRGFMNAGSADELA
ncbi:hypothetical protein STEG23_010582, partial [Scotinomys teguina]